MGDEFEIQEQAGPGDLAEAFKIYQQQNANVAGDPVQEGQIDPGESDDSEGNSEPGVDERIEEGDGSGGEPVQAGGHSDAGGPADDYEPVDYNAWKKNEVDSIGREAVSMANEEFKKHDIKKFGINDLYRRDEQTGEVTFLNPDNPNQPFSTRSQAQEWINSFNQQVDTEFRKLAYQKQKEIYENRQPTLRMIEFGPTYERMSEDEKAVFDSLVEPYTVNDENGEPVGFSCDLNAAAVQASKIVSRFSSRIGKQQEQQGRQEQPAGSGPALDMKGSRTNKEPKSDEPKTLAEAMAMYNKKKGN